MLGCPDRSAREVIASLQKEYNIINLQDGRGYVIGTDEQVRRYVLQEHARARKIFIKANAMLKRCTLTEGIRVPVRAHFRTIKARTEIDNQISMEDIV